MLSLWKRWVGHLTGTQPVADLAPFFSGISSIDRGLFSRWWFDGWLAGGHSFNQSGLACRLRWDLQVNQWGSWRSALHRAYWHTVSISYMYTMSRYITDWVELSLTCGNSEITLPLVVVQSCYNCSTFEGDVAQRKGTNDHWKHRSLDRYDQCGWNPWNWRSLCATWLQSALRCLDHYFLLLTGECVDTMLLIDAHCDPAGLTASSISSARFRSSEGATHNGANYCDFGGQSNHFGHEESRHC